MTRLLDSLSGRNARPEAGARGQLSGSGLEAGRAQRRLSGFLPGRDHVNTLVQSTGGTVLSRSRYLVRNNAYATNAVECFAANLVGYGIKPSWLVKRKAVREAGQKLYKAWTDQADAEGLTDFYGLQRRVARELFIAGECFIRRRPRRLSDGLIVPVQIEILPSEMCPTNSWTSQAAGNNKIRQGIEFDLIGRRVAYHFCQRHPGDVTQDGTMETVRVPAEQIIHVIDPVEAGQLRGLPRLTSSIVKLWTLDGYDDAELERKKTSAMYTGFITTSSDPTGEIDEGSEDGNAGTVTLEPGTMQVLQDGESVTFSTPADVGGSYEAFQYRTLTQIAAALGLPYAAVSGDLNRANYSNTRAGLLEVRRRLEALQHSVVVFQMCRGVWRWFLDAAFLSGALSMPGYAADPRPYLDVNWIPPRWEWVDPYKDRQAEVIAVKSGFKARSQVIEQEGEDPVEVDTRIAEDAKRAKKLGIQFVDIPGVVDPSLMPDDREPTESKRAA